MLEQSKGELPEPVNRAAEMGAMTDQAPMRVRHAVAQHAQTLLVDWMLGNSCNYACSYCPAALHDGSVRWQSEPMVTSMFRRLDMHYARGLGRRVWLQFTGGEPTMHPRIVPLLEQAKTFGFKVSLISNAGRTVRFWERIASNLDAAILTYHQEFADHVHFISVAQRLSERMPVHVNVTVHPDRFDETMGLAEDLCGKAPDITLTLKPLRVGFGTELYDYTEAQLERMQTRLTQSKREDATIPRSVMVREFEGGGHDVRRANALLMAGQNRWRGYICEAGLESLRITADGRISRAVCGAGGQIGRLGQPLDFPVSPITCPKESCACVADILISKRRAQPPE